MVVSVNESEYKLEETDPTYTYTYVVHGALTHVVGAPTAYNENSAFSTGTFETNAIMPETKTTIQQEKLPTKHTIILLCSFTEAHLFCCIFFYSSYVGSYSSNRALVVIKFLKE